MTRAPRKLVRTPGFCGGRLRFEGTRLPVECVLNMLENGAGMGEILESYPGINAEDVENVRQKAKARRAFVRFAKKVGEPPVTVLATMAKPRKPRPHNGYCLAKVVYMGPGPGPKWGLYAVQLGGRLLGWGEARALGKWLVRAAAFCEAAGDAKRGAK